MSTDHPQPTGDCAAIREEFSALLDDELSPSERARVEAHLAECSECLRALDTLKRVADLYAAMPAVHAPANFEARVRAAAVQPNVVSFPRRHARTLGLLAVAAAGVVLIAVPFALRESSNSTMQMASNKEDAKQSVAASPAAAPGVATDAAKGAALDERRQEQLHALGYLEDGKKSKDTAAAAAPAMPEAPKPKPLAAAPTPAPSPAPVAREALPTPAAESAPAPTPEAKPEPKPESSAAPEPQPEPLSQRSVAAKPAQNMPALAAGAPAAPPASVEAKKEIDNATPPREDADAGAMQVPTRAAGGPRPGAMQSPINAGGGFGGGLAKAGKAKTAAPASAVAETDDNKVVATKADAARTWSAAGRTFTRDGAVWKESGYNGEAAKPLRATGREFQRLVKAFPDLKQLIGAEIPVFFKSGTTWYKLLPKAK